MRIGGPPDEWHADLTLGLKPTPGMLLIKDTTTASGASANRSFPASRTSVVEAPSCRSTADGRCRFQPRRSRQQPNNTVCNGTFDEAGDWSPVTQYS
jgi:hypothetical protein